MTTRNGNHADRRKQNPEKRGMWFLNDEGAALFQSTKPSIAIAMKSSC